MQKDIALYAAILRESEKPVEEQTLTYEDITGVDKASAADILARFQAKKDAEAKAAAEKPIEEAPYVKEIVITDAKMDNTKCIVVYDMVWTDSKTNKDQKFEIDSEDDEFIKLKRQIHAAEDLNAAVAMLQQAFDSRAKHPIEYTYFNKKTGVKAKETAFAGVKAAKSRIKSEKPVVDPETAFAAELAARMQRAYGSKNLRYSYTK